MADEQKPMDRIVESMREPLRRYVDLVRELAGAKGKALTLFGAVVAGIFDPKRHTVRNVLVVDQVDLAMLRRLSEHGTRLGKSHIAAPLIMTPPYIKASLDTFALELIEIQQQHLTLFGEDHFADLAFQDGHIRLQCERELKTILIGLRQGLLAAAGREKFIKALDAQVAETLLRTLRGLLWLKGQRIAKPAKEVVGKVEEIVERKLSGLRTALEPTAQHGWDEFERLYQDVEALGEAVNAW